MKKILGWPQWLFDEAVGTIAAVVVVIGFMRYLKVKAEPFLGRKETG